MQNRTTGDWTRHFDIAFVVLSKNFTIKNKHVENSLDSKIIIKS